MMDSRVQSQSLASMNISRSGPVECWRITASSKVQKIIGPSRGSSSKNRGWYAVVFWGCLDPKMCDRYNRTSLTHGQIFPTSPNQQATNRDRLYWSLHPTSVQETSVSYKPRSSFAFQPRAARPDFPGRAFFIFLAASVTDVFAVL